VLKTLATYWQRTSPSISDMFCNTKCSYKQAQ